MGNKKHKRIKFGVRKLRQLKIAALAKGRRSKRKHLENSATTSMDNTDDNPKCQNMADRAVSSTVQYQPNEHQPLNDAVTADGIQYTTKIEPIDVCKHEELEIEFPFDRKVGDSTVVKSEPADVDDVYSSEVAGSVGPPDVEGAPEAATAVKQETDITINSAISEDVNIAVKHEEFDLKLHLDHDVKDSAVVKSEPADVDDVYSSEVAGSVGSADVEDAPDAATAMKQEIDIGPTELQPPDVQFTLQLYEPEQEEKTLLEYHENEDNSSSAAECTMDTMQLHMDTNQASMYKPHVNQSTRVVLQNKLSRQAERLHKCDVCFKSFNRKGNLKVHMLTHADVRPYSCDDCNRSFLRMGDLKMHMLTHSGERQHRCDVCSKSFKRMDHLKGHMLIHTGERQHKCDVCFKSFNRIGHLKSHKLTHPGEGPHKCDVCFKRFITSDVLKAHMLTHTGERPHKCDVCFKSFNRLGHLKGHVLTHSAERPHKCDVCFKSFIRADTLKSHMLTHTGEQLVKCDVCFKGFNWAGNLKAHMLTHTGERPHNCDVCFKSFKTTGNLNAHMLTHAEERPHKCDVCFKSFKRPGNLKMHMLTHSGERLHKCDVCFKSFTRMDILKEHMLTHR